MSPIACLLPVHVAGGVVALLVGPVAMLARKGGALHRRAGWAFAAAMGASALSAVPLAALTGSRLLLAIGVLTTFLIGTGLRAAAFRRGTRPGVADAAGALAALGFGAWLLREGITSGDVIALFFGAGGCVLALVQLRRQSMPGADWLLAHLAAMGGAYIATVTAFLVVNVAFVPRPALFIGPTLIGSTLIALASRRHARAAGAPAAAA